MKSSTSVICVFFFNANKHHSSVLVLFAFADLRGWCSIFLDATANARRENLGGDAGGVRSSGTPGATMQRGRAAPRQLRANKQIDK
jgi:hypothetical protein